MHTKWKKKNSARKKFTKSKKKNDKKVKNLNVLNWSAYKMSRSWKRKQDCFVQFFLFHFCYFNRSFLCSQAVVEIVVVVFISPFKSRLCWFALARFAISSKLRAKQAAQIEWQKAIRIENLRIKRKKNWEKQRSQHTTTEYIDGKMSCEYDSKMMTMLSMMLKKKKIQLFGSLFFF